MTQLQPKGECTHDRYRTKYYMLESNALKAIKKGDITRMGNVVQNCEDCGIDISFAKRVKVKVFESEKVEVKKYNIIIRGEKSSMICYKGETIEEAEKECRLKFGEAFDGISE